MLSISIILMILMIPVILLFSLGLPILIGVFVYRDADKRVDCTPMLWALVAALVPSFIGLVVYLIIRRDYPLKADAGSETACCQEHYEAAAKPAGLPAWAKALIIIGVVIVAICIICAVIAAINYFTGYGYMTGGYHDIF